MTKTGDTYQAANPKHCGRALTFINIIHVPFNKREAKNIYIIGMWYWCFFSLWLRCKRARSIFFFLILRLCKCGTILHVFMNLHGGRNTNESQKHKGEARRAEQKHKREAM